MNITIVSVGEKMPAWVEVGLAEYSKRFGRELKLTLKTVKPEKRGGIGAGQGMAAEEARIRAAMPAGVLPIVLDERGQAVTSVALADYLQKWMRDGAHPCFVIGGADGISPALKADAALMLRLSDLTLPHGMARVLLVEQLYRALSIIHNHPYHRE